MGPGATGGQSKWEQSKREKAKGGKKKKKSIIGYTDCEAQVSQSSLLVPFNNKHHFHYLNVFPHLSISKYVCTLDTTLPIKSFLTLPTLFAVLLAPPHSSGYHSVCLFVITPRLNTLSQKPHQVSLLNEWMNE